MFKYSKYIPNNQQPLQAKMHVVRQFIDKMNLAYTSVYDYIFLGSVIWWGKIKNQK